MSLEGDFSSCDTNDEKELTYGDFDDIYYYHIIHSFFSKYPILDYDIYVLYPSHFLHTSLLDGTQPSEF